MSYCLNPDCHNPQNPDNNKFCHSCGSGLLLGNRYRALKLIGQGGFSKTFFAIDEYQQFKPRCVIKQFFPQAQGTNDVEKAAQLFEQEAVRLKELGQHPQIPTLLAYLTQNQQQYLVQEFIDGRNLAEELEQEGAFKEAQVRLLLNNLLQVLQFVHERQVIHRDIKPANIIRRLSDSQLVLVDFGAAKVVTGSALLRTGTRIGSPEYVAPEQVRGKAVFASDLYSLGATCIHLLTQLSPFDLFDTNEDTWIWQQYLSKNQISDQLRIILEKLLQNAINRRYQSADQVLKDLESKRVSSDAETYYKQGIKKRNQGDHQAAVEDFTQALLRRDDYAEAYKHRAIAYSKLGEDHAAKADFQKAAQLYISQGKIKDSQDILARLEQLQSSSKYQTVIGIDLGTTKSVMAVMSNGKPMIIPNAEGLRATPSVVAYNSRGDQLIGEVAKCQMGINPQNSFSSIMRLIGRSYDEVIEEANQVSYKLFQDTQGKIKIVCPVLQRHFTPEEVLAQLLRHLAHEASQYLGEIVLNVVLTVPAYFNAIQRQAVKEAGQLAGLKVVRIIPQTTAAAVAYGWQKKARETILVLDLGGGHFSVSLLENADGIFEVLVSSGDTHLGGNDFNQKIVDWLLDEFEKIESIDLRQNSQALQRLTEAAENAKLELSHTTQTEISLPHIVVAVSGSKHLDFTLTRSKFEELCADLINRIRVLVEEVIQDALFTKANIQEVILIGGSTRLPAVQKLVKQLFEKEPTSAVDLEESVALGSAVQADVLVGKLNDLLWLDVIPFSLGIETIGGVMTTLVARNSTIPYKKMETFSTAFDDQTNLAINILQGEKALARDNKSLGIFRFDGIAPAPKGIPQIKVTFEFDANGILSVSAIDKATKKELSVTITGAS